MFFYIKTLYQEYFSYFRRYKAFGCTVVPA